MSHRKVSVFLGGFAGLVFLVSAVWLALGIEAAGRLVPPGSDELRIVTPPTISRVHVNYRLPRGQTWSLVLDRLTRQGWIIADDGPRVLWPELIDDSRASAIFWRIGLFGVVRQWLAVRRDPTDHRIFTAELIQCVRLAPLTTCG